MHLTSFKYIKTSACCIDELAHHRLYRHKEIWLSLIASANPVQRHALLCCLEWPDQAHQKQRAL